MMSIRKTLAASAFALAALPLAHADELSQRTAIRLEMQAAWLRDDFRQLDANYRAARDSHERMATGTFKSSRQLWAVSGVPSLPPRNDPAYEDQLKQVEQKLLRWQRQQPSSSLAALMLTHVYLWHGFHYRGEGLGSSVTPEAGKMWHKYLQLAADHLAAPALEHDDAWYYAQFTLAKYRGVPPPAIAAMLEEASAKNPGDYDLYVMAAQAFEPKWGGSLEAVDWAADLGARRTQASEGETVYARVYWAYAQGTDVGDDLFGTTRADWPRMKRGLDEIVRRYPDPWNLNYYALFACQAQDAQALRLALDRLGGTFEPVVWKKPVRLHRCRELAHEAG